MKPGDAGVRQEIRVGVQFDVTVARGDDSATFTTENMGAGGCFVQTSWELERGETLTVSFSIPGLKHVFRCRGEVRWRRVGGSLSTGFSPGVGLRFLDLNDLERSVLRGSLLRIASGVESVSPAFSGSSPSANELT